MSSRQLMRAIIAEIGLSFAMMLVFELSSDLSDQSDRSDNRENSASVK